jgi:hypothetical protein
VSKRTPAALRHRPEVNRLPDYFGLPEGLFHALGLAAFALWAASGFSRYMALVAAGLALFVGAALVPLAAKDPGLPRRRLAVLLRFAQPLPAVSEWSLR